MEMASSSSKRKKKSFVLVLRLCRRKCGIYNILDLELQKKIQLFIIYPVYSQKKGKKYKKNNANLRRAPKLQSLFMKPQRD